MRRKLPRLLSLTCTALLCGSAAQAQTYTSTQIATGLTNPTDMASPPGDSSRLFILRQNGLVRLVKNGTLLPTPALDISALTTGTGERGLLGIAFHPDYQANGKVYISYTNTSGNSVVRQYLRDALDHDLFDPASFTTIIGPITQDFSNHNGGCIKFGPDGMLYYGLGDGGSGNDPNARAQNPMSLLGKMLRLDVDAPFPHVPADNPFVGDPSTHDLIWALGLRNPWRFSFDRVTGDLWIGDVGQNAREEINFQPAASTGGENYGWRCMEGLNCTGLSGCTCNGPNLTLPVHTYATGSNCSITGGFLYRGSLMPSLYGHYFLADYCSGRIWTFLPNANGTPSGPVVDRSTQFGLPANRRITSFGEDSDGELYVVARIGTTTDGRVWRLEEVCSVQIGNFCTSTANSHGSGAILLSLGTGELSANDFQLWVIGAATNQSGVFFYGPQEILTPFGDGFLCVGPGNRGVFRLNGIIFTDGMGSAVMPWDMTVPPSSSGPGLVQAGETWKAQFWFRDSLAGQSGFNTSNGLSVTFCP